MNGTTVTATLPTPTACRHAECSAPGWRARRRGWRSLDATETGESVR